MKNLITLVCFLVIVPVFKNNNICSLSGKLENLNDDIYLYLWDYDSLNLVDSIFVKKGTFTYTLTIEHPKQYILANKYFVDEFRDRKIIWLEPGEIELTGNFLFLKNLKVNGSKSQHLFDEYNQVLKGNRVCISRFKDSLLFKEDLIIDNLVYLPMDSLNKKKEQAIESFNLLKKNCSRKLVNHLIANKNSYVTLSALYHESHLKFERDLNKFEIKEVFENLPDFFKSSEKGIQIKKFIDIPCFPEIGYLAPEVIQTDITGDTVKLSDYRGKYVLLYFWASWCKPCRASHKSLKEIYKKYNQEGFEILGVSWDKEKSKWENAVFTDSLPWRNISDLKSINSDAFLTYNIRGVPSGFLIDKEGVIKSIYYDTNFLLKELNTIFEINEKE